MSHSSRRLCGCFYGPAYQPTYLPMVGSEFHSTILATSSSTKLTQTFSGPSKEAIEKVKYVFPLYDGVSVVSFTCHVDGRTLHGVVHEKVEAAAIFDKAVAEGKSAGLLEQSEEAADVFSTSLGNVPAGAKIVVEICYAGELKHDAEADGIRFTIPTAIAPRYGSVQSVSVAEGVQAIENKGISITVDVNMPADSPIQNIQSPSHPIAVSLGVLSTAQDGDMSMNKASATLSQGESALGKDFVVVIKAKDSGNPTAVLELHPTLPNQRAIITSLVPKFSLPPARPEIIFIADRSGSMASNIPMLKDAMKVFLKSLPAGVKFNILSFGSNHSTLWSKSKAYSKETLTAALQHVETFASDFGGTETLNAIKAAIKARLSDLPLDMILLTDGDIWQQQQAFAYLYEQVRESRGGIRLFPLGIGSGVSHSLIEGLARSGNGFAQAVQNGERFDKRIVRMLRGALSPHVYNYTLEVKYQAEDDFELVDKVHEDVRSDAASEKTLVSSKSPKSMAKKVISLFDSKADPEKEPLQAGAAEPLPVSAPKILQGPHHIPSLFAFSRTTVYLLLSPDTIQKNPECVVLRGSTAAGPLELEIPIETLGAPGATLHQLAARKVVQDLEEGRGRLHDATDAGGDRLAQKFPSRFEDAVKREAVALGTRYQIANRWCSFVAVAAGSKDEARAEAERSAADRARARAEAEQARDRERAAGGASGSVRARAAYAGLPRARAAPVGSPQASSCFAAVAPAADEEEADEDMGFGLFDEAPPSARAAPPPAPGGPPSFGAMEGARSRTSVGFGGGGGRGRGAHQGQQKQLASKAARKCAPSADYRREAAAAPPSPDPPASKRKLFARKSAPSFPAAAPPPPAAAAPPATDSERVHRLIELQDFDGFWADAPAVWEALGIEQAAAAKVAPEGAGTSWVTTVVLEFLETKMAGERDVWEMIAEKARVYLDGLGLEDRKGLEAAAKQLVGA